MKRRTISLRTQLLILQLVIVFATLAITGGVSYSVLQAQWRNTTEVQMTTVAQRVATLPAVLEAFDTPDPAARIQPLAETIREASGVTYVVVTDLNGIRYSHPNPANIGQVVSTEPDPVLEGESEVWTGTETGTLGESWRVKVPVKDEGRIIGMVSVGVLTAEMNKTVSSSLLGLLPWLVLAGLLGTAGAVWISRLVWRRIYRMEPEEIAELRRSREAMLHGLGEGIIAFDDSGRAVLINDEATRLLDVRPDDVGRTMDQLLDGPLLNLAKAGPVGQASFALAGERVLSARLSLAVVDDEVVGRVLILRDRTELHELERDLDGAKGLTDALRAQAHEKANQLHVISGLVELGLREEVLEYIAEVAPVRASSALLDLPEVNDPAVESLLLAKAVIAAERHITLRIDPGTQVQRDAREDLVAVLGNLLDNALDAVGPGGHVEVSARFEDAQMRLWVDDDGPGVPSEERERIFHSGVSTKSDAGYGRGVGLALVDAVVMRRGGKVTVSDSPHGGARFTVVWPISAGVRTS